MGAHAVLSPSASARWMQCPASVRMTRDHPRDESSPYAIEGTQFHTLCEVEASRRLLHTEPPQYAVDYLDWALETDEDWHEDQLRYVEGWIAFLEHHMAEDPDTILLLEQRVDTGIPGCWGTADAVLIQPNLRKIKVIDIKYGAGVKVSAVENPQLMLYGVGGLGLVKDPLTIDEVEVIVWQPRMHNVSDYVITREALEKWRDDLIPTAILALGEYAPFGPSEAACRWCPIAGTCGPRTRAMLAADFGDPDRLGGDELAEAYSRVADLKQWANDIEDAALKMAYEEPGYVTGYKVVRSGGRRGITNDEKAIDTLISAGYDADQVSRRSAQTLGVLDKLVGGKDELQQILGDLLATSEGRLSLAPESDPRPPADALHSAQDDFADITE